MRNWDFEIEQICKRLEVDPQVYNDDDDAKEVVAKLLGFPSYDCFAALPEPEAIADGRGTPLLEGHKMQQLSLGTDCIEIIKSHYQLSDDEYELEKEITRFIKYMEDNFDDEFSIACMATLFAEMKNVYDISEFPIITANHKQWMSNKKLND